MEPCLLMWGILTFITVSGYTTDLCDDDPPNLKHATFKALTYKTGTVLNCDCERGFRRISSYMHCTGNSSHASWENKCQCKSISPENRKGKVTTKPEEQKGENPTEMQSQTPPMDEVDLVGHCREPPPWEHENSKRIYHFVVGQTLHYQCMQGFTALHRGPAKSICKTIFGKTRWTQPPLKCISESQFPDDEELQASTDAPAGRDTSSPFITTSTPDFHKHTEVATTMESFIFTTEYQIAGGSGALPLLTTPRQTGVCCWLGQRAGGVVDELKMPPPYIA
uniref:Interleukin-2 receptor subunit alpha n=1 Tax=Canis lupus familiaris TaxID=9615 RepID=A0A8P0TQS1_CANLF